MNTYSKLAKLNQDLNRLRRCDRDSFFGRMEIVEWVMEEEHSKVGEKWYKFGRYGNVVNFYAFHRALLRLRDEFNFSQEELNEQRDWNEGQGKMYGNPDQIAAAVMWDFLLNKPLPTP